MIQIVLFTNYCTPNINKGMTELLKNNDSLTVVGKRVKLAEYVKANVGKKITSAFMADDAVSFLEKNPSMFVLINQFENVSQYACWDHTNNCVKTFFIKEVDDSKLWTIRMYDGNESVVYFGEPTIIDAKYNYCKWA